MTRKLLITGVMVTLVFFATAGYTMTPSSGSCVVSAVYSTPPPTPGPPPPTTPPKPTPIPPIFPTPHNVLVAVGPTPPPIPPPMPPKPTPIPPIFPTPR